MATIINEGLKQKQGRGSSFLPSEDAAIAKALISASEDPIVGAEQKGVTFFNKIHDLYETKFKPANRDYRTVESIKSRCKAIHKECMVFSGCFARVVRAQPTGVAPADMINMATALYSGVQMDSATGDCGKPFKFALAWNILKEHKKFLAGENDNAISGITGTEVASSDRSDKAGGDLEGDGRVPLEENTNEEEKETGRPIGRKRAKVLREKGQDNAKKLTLAAESVQAQKERNEALRRHYEIMLFTNAPAGCDTTKSLEYFRIMRARALSKLREEERNESGESANNAEQQ